MKALRAIEMENVEAAHYRASNAYWLSKVSFVSGSLIAILPIVFLLSFTIKFMDVMATGVPLSAILQIYWSCKFDQYEVVNPCLCSHELSNMDTNVQLQMPKSTFDTCRGAFSFFDVRLDFVKVQR